MDLPSSALYQSKEIRALEKLATTQCDLDDASLMHRAARAACTYILRYWPTVKKIAIVCGGGNNGGDGYTLALYARQKDLQVSLYPVDSTPPSSEEAAAAFKRTQEMRIPCFSDYQFDQAELIVDAVCGIGLAGPLHAPAATAVAAMNAAHLPILALDVPTGVDADTGKVWNEAVHATATLSFIGAKLGLVTGQGIEYTGKLWVDQLNLPSSLFAAVSPCALSINPQDYATFFKARSRNWHKGLSGHVLIIGGDSGYTGSVCLAAEAALRMGSGLVSIATRAQHAALMNIHRPEIMAHGVETIADLEPLIAKANTIIIGPGLGQSAWAKNLWDYVSKLSVPLVVDADALNLLSHQPKHAENWILTPHPGEAARLLQVSTDMIQENRLAQIKSIVDQYGGTCVLKGAGSIIYSQDKTPLICTHGNPGMASAGMGDVLSGVIGSLIGQGLTNQQAASLGVYLHAAAGDQAATHGERGLIASDLFRYLRQLSNSLF